MMMIMMMTANINFTVEEKFCDTLESLPSTAASVKALLNPLLITLKPQSNGPSYSNTLIGTLTVDGRAVTFGAAKKGLGNMWSILVFTLKASLYVYNG